MSKLIELNNLPGAREKYPHIFSSMEIRGVSIPSKIIWPPWALKFADEGKVTEKLIKFYTSLAEGGCGLIITGAAVACVDSAAPGFEGIMRAYSDEYTPGLKKLFAAIEAKGSVPGLQIVRAGSSVTNPGPGMDVILTPSGVPNPALENSGPAYKLRAMTIEEIKKMRQEFIDTAMRSIKAGARLIDIHGGHGYMLAQFLSPLTNTRTDEYGGSRENRGRIITEIIKGLREAAGDSIIISVRLSANEFLEGGLVPKDYKELLPLWEKMGLDIVNASNGHAVLSGEYQIPPEKAGPIPYVSYITQLKEYTHLPVVAVGSIWDMETAEMLLREKKADIIALGRVQFADTSFVKKCAEGREKEIRSCKHDNACINSFFKSPEVICTVNPEYKGS